MPLAIVGVVIALEMLGVPISVVVFIGLIMLAGIVVNNAIVLIDRINKKRIEGMELVPAVIEAGRARLRPILMTTFATVLGVVPLLLAVGAGANSRYAIGMMIAAGMMVGTLFTLLVLPVFYLPLLERGTLPVSGDPPR